MKEFTKEGLYFLPLGGADEIGLNMYVYAVDGKLLVVDCGYGFLADDYPGIDLSFPDASFLEDYKDNIEALLITHAHEDHFGAIGHIWGKLQCPVYGTRFAVGMMKERLKEFDLDETVPLNIVPDDNIVKLPSFEIEYASVVHNVPETGALIIRTKYGNAVHATDWRFDDGRSDLLPTNIEALERAGREGVKLLVCDSTNVMVDIPQHSESEVRECILKLMPTFENTVVATCFSSNLTRLATLIEATAAAGRTPVLVGRSLLQNMKVARDCGYFNNLPNCLDITEAKDIPSDKVVYIVTGSQANYRSALTLIAKNEKKDIKVGKGDVVLFSSRVIPGNEKAIERMQEDLVTLGADIITQDEYLVHTTGHPNKSDLRRMYEILKPDIIVPVHGEKRFIKAHKKFAQECGVKRVETVLNGDIMLVEADDIFIEGRAQTGVLCVDRNNVISLDSQVIKNRRRIAFNCSLYISVVFDNLWKIKDLKITSVDILEEDKWQALTETIKEDILRDFPARVGEFNGKENQIVDFVRSQIRKKVEKATDTKPTTIIHWHKCD